jgi:hygromycin-B 7''-O-kinase
MMLSSNAVDRCRYRLETTAELIAVGLLFVSRGDPRLLGRILAAYGRSFDPRELLAYTLLHVHSNLPECLSELPAPPEPTLDSLALTWFGTA